MTPDPVPAGIPLTSGAGAPEPWNANDLYIWTNLILKYACIEAPTRNPLQASEFALIETAQRLRPTYQNEEEKERAIRDKKSTYYVLLETCLQSLHKLSVLRVGELLNSSDGITYMLYYRTDLLTKKVCPAIHKEPAKVHDINSILKE
jgi:hypothetical protein